MNNRVTDFFSNKKIWARLASFMIITTILPSVLIFVVANIGINRINTDYNSKYIMASEQAVEENLKTYTNRINTTYLSIISNIEFFEILNSENNAERSERLKMKLDGLVTDYIKNIDIIDNNFNVTRVLDDDGIEPLSRELIIKCHDEDNNWETTVSDSHGRIYYIISKKLINIDTVKEEGYIVFYVPERDICNAYSDSITDYDSMFIVNSNGTIVSDIDKKRITSSFFFNDIEDSGTVVYNNHKHYISKYKMYGGSFFPRDWSVVQMISSDKIDILLTLLRDYLMILFLIILAVIPMLSLIFSNRIVKPIGKLEKRMIGFEKGEFGKKKQSKKIQEDEIALFEKKFDEMDDKIHELIEQNNKEKDKQRMAELNTLQAQINPHFIYNTLDSISWLAAAKEQDEIVEIVYALSKFFEISLHKGRNYVTVEQEIEHIKSYITIEEIRFPGLFEIDFDVDREIVNERMIKIILQPIVENAIKHGVRELGGRQGKIKVSARGEGEYIIFVISDNGVGYDTSVEPEKGKKGGYGLKNTQTRIKMEYGKDCGIFINSVIGEGTEVTVKIRKKDKFFGEDEDLYEEV